MACRGILSAAVTVKLTRTLAIIPITLILALIRMQRAKKRGVQAEGGYLFQKGVPIFYPVFHCGSTDHNCYRGTAGKRIYCLLQRFICNCHEMACQVFHRHGYVCHRFEYESD